MISRGYEQITQSEGRYIRDCLLLLLLFGFLFLHGLGNAPLIDPDEGRYAEIPREMLVQSDFITPTLNYVKYFEKPPLLYWANAASLHLLGQTEFAARLPSVLSGLFTVLLTYIAGRRLFNRQTGNMAALILGSCAAFMMQSRIILTDMLLTFCLTAALFSFIMAARSKEGGGKNLYRIFFIFCGLAVLAKGLIGIVLPAGIILLYVLLDRRWELLAKIPWISGLLLFLLITAPWFVLVSIANPEFPHFFFIREHFQRYTTEIHSRSQPFWFFLPILLLTMLPWSFFLPGSLGRALRERLQNKGLMLYLLLWPLVIILFFSFSSSKLIPYILPAFPPLALLLAVRFSQIRQTRKPDYNTALAMLAGTLLICGIGIALLPLQGWLIPVLHSSGQTGRQLAGLLSGPEPVLGLKQTMLPGGLLTIFGLLLFWMIRTRSSQLLVLLLCCFGILLELLLPAAFTKFAAEELSCRQLAKVAIAEADSNTFMAQSGLRQSMNFYTGRRLITVGDPDELEFGKQHDSQKGWFMSQEQFNSFWRSGQRVMIVIHKRELELYSVERQGIEARVLADNANLRLLANY